MDRHGLAEGNQIIFDSPRFSVDRMWDFWRPF